MYYSNYDGNDNKKPQEDCLSYTYKKRKRIAKWLICLLVFLSFFPNGPLNTHVEEAHAADHSGCSVCKGTGMMDCPKTTIYADVCHQWACWDCGTSGQTEGDDYPCYKCNPKNGEWLGWRPSLITVDCASCLGTGTKICFSCNNTGKQTCSNCLKYGSAVPMCPVCRGYGYSTCSKCKGLSSACENCDATGKQTVQSSCPVCHEQGGGGYIGTWEDCTNCSGNGWVYCFHCSACGAYNDSPSHIKHKKVACTANPKPLQKITPTPVPTQSVTPDDGAGSPPPTNTPTPTKKPTAGPVPTGTTPTPTNTPTPTDIPWVPTPTNTPTPIPVIDITADPNNGDSKYTIHGVKWNTSTGNHLYDAGVPVPAKVGYTLNGWTIHQSGKGNLVYYSNGAAANDGTYWWRNMSQAWKNYTVYAQWVANRYSLVLNSPDTTQSSITKDMTYDKEYVLPASPFIRNIKVSYNKNANDVVYMEKTSETIQPNFVGWSYEKNGALDLEDMATVKNLTTKNNDVINLYTVWNDNTITLFTPTRAGHEFIGWTTRQDGNGTVYKGGTQLTLTEDVVLYAQWDEKQYTVSFDPNGGTAVSPTSKVVTYGKTYGTLPVTTRKGYEFIDWVYNRTNPVTASSLVKIGLDHTLVAMWMPKEYKLTADPNGGTLKGSSLPVNLGTLVYGASNNSTIPIAEQTGHKFLGWSDSAVGGHLVYDKNGKFVGDTTKYFNSNNQFIGSSDVIVYAQWEADKYIVTLDANEGECTPTSKTVSYGDKYGTLPTPVRDCYDFLGWYYNTSTLVDGSSELAANKDHTLVAKWAVESYVISFDWNFNYNSLVTDPVEQLHLKTNYVANTKTVAYNEEYGSLPTPTRKGYTFLGWYTEESSNNGTGTQVTESTLMKKKQDHTLYAQWIANTYTVDFDYNHNWLPYYPK